MEEHERRMRFKNHYRKWKLMYDVREYVGEKFAALWTVEMVWNTMRGIFALIIGLSVVAFGYHLVSNPSARVRELPAIEDIMKLEHDKHAQNAQEGPPKLQGRMHIHKR